MGVLMDNVRQGFNLLFTPVIYYGVVASIALQLGTWERGDRTQDKLQDQYANRADNFDFVIVGAGTAGSVLANRLSQYYSVLLLEAGGEPHPLEFVPGMARDLVNHPQIDWMHRTVAQKKSSAFAQYRRALLSSGKSVGGSGSLDFLTYLRGNPEDFNNWARITKDNSWKYDNLLRHFQRAEDIVANSTDPGAHRHGGEMRIQKSDYLPLAKEFLAAAKELGYPNVDLNGHFSEGFDSIYSTIRKGERQTPVRAFVDPVRKRKTLTIRKFATVNKLRFRSDNTAYAVEYERHGEKYTVYATREIILSAGAIGTPKILMLSGIGPKRHLDEFGIKNLVNLPVGQNLQDHVATYLGPFFINEPLSILKERDVTAKSYFEYGSQGTGPLTSAGFQATGLLASQFAKGRGEDKWPDLQLTLYAHSVGPTFATDIAHTHGLQAELLKKYYNHAIGKNSFHIVTTLSRPAGRGEIRLASRNPTDPLVINPKYLEDPWNLDIKAVVDGLKKAMRIVEGSTTFQNIGGHFTSEVLPGCESTKFRSDEYFECYMRHYTVSMYNPVGSCAMGPADSLFAVVDPKLKVIGTKHLRVVDSSIMPSIVVGGTQAATIMIAEKGAEIILNYWTHHTPADITNFEQEDNLNSIEAAQSDVKERKVPNKGLAIPPQMTSTTTKTTSTTVPTTPAPHTPEPTSPTARPASLLQAFNFKSVLGPFSQSIKSSSPSSKFISEVTPTTSQTTTEAPVTLRTTSIPHVTFPIISSHSTLTPLKKKPQPMQKLAPLSKLNYFSTKTPTPQYHYSSPGTKTPQYHYSSPGTKTPQYHYSSSTPETKAPRRVRTKQTTTPRPNLQDYYYDTAVNIQETTTPPPSSTFSIQKAELSFDTDDNLTATTYRPDIMLIDPQQPDFVVQPHDLTKSMNFGQSIMYLVERKPQQQQPTDKPHVQVEQEKQPEDQINFDMQGPIPTDHLVPPSLDTYQSYRYGQQQQEQQQQPTEQPRKNSYLSPNPQFEFHQELDEGYINDRYPRGNRHLHQVENVKIHHNSPVKILRRQPSKSSGQNLDYQQKPTHKPRIIQQQQQQVVTQSVYKPQEQVQQQVLQPANMVYHGTQQESYNNYNQQSNININNNNNNQRAYHNIQHQHQQVSNYGMSPLSAEVSYQPVHYSYYRQY